MVLFNRDLRVRDNPALAAAAKAKRSVPLFVLDEALLGSRFAAPNRVAFMLEALRDLDEALRRAGGRLYLRRGDPVEEAIAVARACRAQELHVSADWSAYARRREQRLSTACEKERIAFTAHPGTTIVPPGAVTPSGGDHFKVFSPFHRAWDSLPLRQRAQQPRRMQTPGQLAVGRLPAADSLLRDTPSPERARGGESGGRRLMRAFLRNGIANYERRHDNLPGDATSGLSPYLRFGCLSPLELLREARSHRGGAVFARQLCWRDFHHQVLTAFPDLPRRDYRPRGDRWSRSQRAFDAWREGCTGYPIVDAAMRQLAREGRMHNRARMIAASFLIKDLYLDWRWGARHFWDLLATERLPTTRATGSGSPVPETTRAPTASSTQSARPTASTPTGPTCAATCRSLKRSRGAPSTSPGGYRGGSVAIWITPSRSSITTTLRLPSWTAAHRIGAMGRLAVILGSSALGPGGETVAAAAASTAPQVVQRHGGAGPTASPIGSTMRPICGPARGGLRPGAGNLARSAR